MFHARLSYIEGKLHIRVKFLWITLYDNLKPRKSKEKKKKADTIKKSAAKKNNPKRKTKTQVASKLEKDSPARAVRKPAQEDRTKRTEQPKQEKKPDLLKMVETAANPETIGQPEESTEVKLVKQPEELMKPAEHTANAGKAALPKEDNTESENKSGQADKVKEEKTNFFGRLIAKIKGFISGIKAFFIGLKDRITQLFDTVSNIRNKIGLISDFIKDKLNREGFRITYRSLKRILRHIKPTKLKSRLVFGTGDPCSTGQALGIIGILYSFYGDNVQIIPDFENKVFEGKHYARGRIRLITIIIIIIKLILDKRFQLLRKNFQLLKEAL
jgi:hypothetical protein